jgi:hypothetical protein
MPLFDKDLHSGTCYEAQGFSQNFNPFYHGVGLLGHPAIDINCGYGSPIASYVDGLVYSLYTIDQPANDGYTAIYLICETPLEDFEMCIGHVSHIDVEIGQHVHKGDIIGKEGNHGVVYAGNTLITLAMQKAGDQRGHHRHVQKRPVIKVSRTTPGATYLRSSHVSPYRDSAGFYYQVYEPLNGFAGCVDWTAPLFPRNITEGMHGYDVYLLQRALVLETGFDSGNCTGFVGPLTLRGIQDFQSKNHIVPLPVCGPKTRAILNAKYAQL